MHIVPSWHLCELSRRCGLRAVPSRHVRRNSGAHERGVHGGMRRLYPGLHIQCKHRVPDKYVQLPRRMPAVPKRIICTSGKQLRPVMCASVLGLIVDPVAGR